MSKKKIDIRRYGNKDMDTLLKRLSNKLESSPIESFPNIVVMTRKQFVTLLETMLYEDEDTLPDITFSRVMLLENCALDVVVKRRWL